MCVVMTGINAISSSKKMASKEFFARKSTTKPTTAANKNAAPSNRQHHPSSSSSSSTNFIVPKTSSQSAALRFGNFKENQTKLSSANNININATAKNSNNNNNNDDGGRIGGGVADNNEDDDDDQHHFECFELIKFKSLPPKPKSADYNDDDDGGGSGDRTPRRRSSGGINVYGPSINPTKQHQNNTHSGDNRKQNRYGSGSASKIKSIQEKNRSNTTNTTLPSPVPEILSTTTRGGTSSSSSCANSIFKVMNFDDPSPAPLPPLPPLPSVLSGPCSNTTTTTTIIDLSSQQKCRRDSGAENTTAHAPRNCGINPSNDHDRKPVTPSRRRKKINPSNNNNNNDNIRSNCSTMDHRTMDHCSTTTTTTTAHSDTKTKTLGVKISDTNDSKTRTTTMATTTVSNNSNNNKCVGHCKKSMKNHSTPSVTMNNNNNNSSCCSCSHPIGTNNNKPIKNQDNNHCYPEPLLQVLFTLKDQNKNLIKEIEDLRIKLEDAEGDLKLVQCQMRQMSKQMVVGGLHQQATTTTANISATTIDPQPQSNKNTKLIDENLLVLNELEFFKEKVILLERDIQTLLVEKEAAILERNTIRNKNEQLNEHLISMIKFLPNLNHLNNPHHHNTTPEPNELNPYHNPLGGGPRSLTPIVGATGSGAAQHHPHPQPHNPQMSNDIDALYLENRYLKEKIKNDDEERSLLLDRLATYKDLAADDYGHRHHHHQPAPPPPPAQHHRHHQPSDEFGLAEELINDKSHHQQHGNPHRHHHHHHQRYSPASGRTKTQPSTCDTIIQPFDGGGGGVGGAGGSGSYTNDVHFDGGPALGVDDNPLPREFQLSDGHIVDVRDIETMVSVDALHSMEVNRSNQVYLWELLRALYQGLQGSQKNSCSIFTRTAPGGGAKSSSTSMDMATTPTALKPPPPRPQTSGPILTRYHHHHCDPIVTIENISSGAGPKFELHDRQSPLFHHNYPYHLDDHGGGGGDTLPTTTTTTTATTITPKETSDDDVVEEFDSISTPSTTRRSMSIERQLRALQNDALKDDDDDHPHHHLIGTSPPQPYPVDDLSPLPLMAAGRQTPTSDPKTGYDDDDGYKCDFDVVALDTSNMHHLMMASNPGGKKSPAAAASSSTTVASTTVINNKLYN